MTFLASERPEWVVGGNALMSQKSNLLEGG